MKKGWHIKKVYLAARYGRRKEMLEYKKRLENIGVEVTSSWVNGEHETLDAVMTPSQAQDFALDDIEDICEADTLISFTEKPNSSHSRGGRHVEFGFAYACGKDLVVIGPHENIFHHVGEVSQYDSFESFMCGVFVDDTEARR